MLRLYDTRLRSVVDIVPSTPGVLSIYACGPTVYRAQHVGNLRSQLLPDMIGRVAAWHKLQVRFVQNITDVGHLDEDSGEDKMVAEAQARGLTPLEIAHEIEELFHADARALNCYPALANPRATDYVPQMISLTKQLISGGHAYESGGSVFYDAKSFPTYGEISGNRIADLNAQASGRVSAGEEAAKRFHADWALWRGNTSPREGELSFASPWGPGTPGWHIECTAMSLELLGDVFDVHTGGIDLRFPHHEDERAQSNSVAGHEVVRHWVHGEHLLFNKRKMSKSVGNVVYLSDLPARGLDPLAVRLSFMTQRYRTQASLSWEALSAADTRLRRWRELVRRWAEHPSAAASTEYVDRVVKAFDDDLDTPTAVKLLGELAKDPAVAEGSKFETFAMLDRLFGLELACDVGQPAKPLPPGAVTLVDEREAARAAKDWARADELRAELLALGVTVADTPEGPVPNVS